MSWFAKDLEHDGAQDSESAHMRWKAFRARMLEVYFAIHVLWPDEPNRLKLARLESFR